MAPIQSPIGTERITCLRAVPLIALCCLPLATPAATAPQPAPGVQATLSLPTGPLKFAVAPPAAWSVPFSGGTVPVTTAGGNAPVVISIPTVPSQYAPYIQIADPPPSGAGGGLPSPTGGIGGPPPLTSPTPGLPPNAPGLPTVATVSKVLKLLPLPATMRVPGSHFTLTVRAQDASGQSVNTSVQVTMATAAGIPVISSAVKLAQPPAVNPDSSNLFALQITNFSANDAERVIICRYSSLYFTSRTSDHLCALQGPPGSQVVVRVPDSGRNFLVQLLAMNREGYSAPITVEPRGTEIQRDGTHDFGLLHEFQSVAPNRFEHGPNASSVSNHMLSTFEAREGTGSCGRQFVVWAAEGPVSIANLRTVPADIIARVKFMPVAPVFDLSPATPKAAMPELCKRPREFRYAPSAVTAENQACGDATYDSNGRALSSADHVIFDVTYRLGVRETPPCERPAN